MLNLFSFFFISSPLLALVSLCMPSFFLNLLLFHHQLLHGVQNKFALLDYSKGSPSSTVCFHASMWQRSCFGGTEQRTVCTCVSVYLCVFSVCGLTCLSPNESFCFGHPVHRQIAPDLTGLIQLHSGTWQTQTVHDFFCCCCVELMLCGILT